MANHTIKAGGMLTNHYLEVSFLGIRFDDPVRVGFGAGRCGFHKIDCVLMSASHVLSIQMGRDIFTIPTDPRKAEHRAAIDTLLEGLKRETR